MNYEDRKRARLEAKERQDSRDNWSRFTAMARQNVSTADEITKLSTNETDLDVLNTLSKKLEDTRTGVDFVDQVIDVSGDVIETRKRTVIAGNKIDEHINTLNEKLGDGITVGAKESLDALDGQYKNIASSMTGERKILLDRKITNAKEHFNLQLWKGEFDTNKELEGNQFPSWMGEHEKSFYTQTVEPGVRVAEASGDYTAAISQLQKAFPTMRREKTAYQTVNQRMDKAAEVDAGKAAKEHQEMLRLKAFTQVRSLLKGVKSSFSSLKNTNKDYDTQTVFSESLPILSQWSESMTAKNLQTLDVRGAVREIDKLIIMNSLTDKNKMKGLIPNYGLDKDPLSEDMILNMERLIADNITAHPKIKGAKRYGAKYGLEVIADDGMFQLIEARKQLIEIFNTPGMLLEEADTTSKPKGKNIKLKSIK